MDLGASRGSRRPDDASATVGLPLRQAMQQQRSKPKIVDITEKFTSACEGSLVCFPFSFYSSNCYVAPVV